MQTDPESIQLVPTRTTFSSANPARNAAKGIDSPDRPPLHESESQSKLSHRNKIDDSDERPRRDTLRPKPGNGDQEGWMEVKPRKSFGAEGAERFTGRMGGERHREEKRFKDREERDLKERPRGFENFSRDKDKNHDQDNNRRTTNGRGRTEPSWFREHTEGPPHRERTTCPEKFDTRHKSWREKEADNRGDRGDKGDRRWGDRDRDHDDQHRSVPEWAAEDKTSQISPQEDYPKSQTTTGNNSRKHTAEDMQKWKEAMHSKNKPAISHTEVEENPQPKVDELSSSGIPKHISLAPLDTGAGADQFFRLWATPNHDAGLTSKFESNTENMTKSAVLTPGGKTSRFNKFFNQDEPSRKVEPQTATPKPASQRFEGLNNHGPSPADKEAMPSILAMLRVQSSVTPPANPSMQSKPAPQEKQPGTHFEGRDPSLQHLSDRHDEMRLNAHAYSHNLQELNAQRESSGSQPTVRPEEMLHHLVNQRQHAASQSPFRNEQPRSEQREFLMSLMRDAQAAPEPQRTEQIILGHPPRQQPNRQLQHQQQQLEREQELQAQRERGNPQRRPPGFFDEPVFRGGPPPQHDNPRPQPTHILTRPPPGLEQLQQGWPGQPSSQHPPPQQFRPTAPPGLAGNVPRPMQMPQPQQILPPGFQMGGAMNNFPPPEALAGRNMQFNPAYFNGPPPGFLPPVMSPFAAEGMQAFPFDGRGPPPPQGAFRRQ